VITLLIIEADYFLGFILTEAQLENILKPFWPDYMYL